ncbi:ClbS/DfsB family four-helix bundle protein [Rhodobacter capsulatus]|uniref:ClbS/DfsB family four-helix bundle protein n=1 Tax=Rhodobacter capsulatus TaxID=1061 RepID=UPI004038AC4A
MACHCRSGFGRIVLRGDKEGFPMAVPGSKAELLSAIATSFDKLMQDCERVPPERAREPSMAGHVAGSMISPADLVSYLIGWNELVLKWLDRDDRGETVDFPRNRLSMEPAGRPGAEILP